MNEAYFMHRIRHYLKDGVPTWDKGIEVHEKKGAAQQSYHAYLGAYAYDHDANTDYVYCYVTDIYGGQVETPVTWIAPAAK